MRSSDPTPLFKQRPTELAAQGCGQMTFEYLKGSRLWTACVCAWSPSQCGNVCSFQRDSPVLQFVLFFFFSCHWTTTEERLSSLQPPFWFIYVESSDLSFALYSTVYSRIYWQISSHREYGKAASVFNIELFSALLKYFPGFTHFRFHLW